MHNRYHAFTLVELSIVLVIIGLIIGGVLTGQSLMRAAETRRIIADSQAYISAAQTFKDQYFYWPGDIKNASDFWFDATTCPTGSVTAGCNGDGRIEYVAGSGSEAKRVWQHMYLADMTTDFHDGTGQNEGHIDGSHWYISYGGTGSSLGSACG